MAYRLDAATVTGEGNLPRNWKNDPWLDEDETLERTPDDDYRLKNGETRTGPCAVRMACKLWQLCEIYSRAQIENNIRKNLFGFSM